jgi:tetratricopeptide (TPR) repeat protein
LAGAAKGFDRMLDVAREIEDIDNQCLALTQRGAVAYAEDDLAGAQERFASSAELARSINDPNLIAYNRVWSGIVLLDMEDYEEAQRSLIDALEYLTDDSAQRLSYTWMEMNRYDTITLAHSTLANIALRIGNLTSARERLWLAMRAAQRIGGARITLRTLSSVAELLLLRGDLLHALEWCGALLSSPAAGAIYQRPLLAIVDRIQPLLSFEEFDAALEHGRMLSLDQLMNKANSVLRHG